jgi:hypothetical protein
MIHIVQVIIDVLLFRTLAQRLVVLSVGCS